MSLLQHSLLSFTFVLRSLPPVDDGEGVKILKGGHNLSGVEERGGVRELPRAEQNLEGLPSKWQRGQSCFFSDDKMHFHEDDDEHVLL